MDDQISRPAPWDLIEALDASVRDIAAGHVADAAAAQDEARMLLAVFENSHSTAGPSAASTRTSVKTA